MSLRFLLDEDLSYRVAEGLRRRGIDAISVFEVGRANKQISDQEQLIFAAAEGRTLVTYNGADYQALDAEWRITGRMHAGILWCLERTISRRSIGDLVRALDEAARAHGSIDGLCLPLVRPSADEPMRTSQ